MSRSKPMDKAQPSQRSWKNKADQKSTVEEKDMMFPDVNQEEEDSKSFKGADYEHVLHGISKRFRGNLRRKIQLILDRNSIGNKFGKEGIKKREIEKVGCLQWIFSTIRSFIFMYKEEPIPSEFLRHRALFWFLVFLSFALNVVIFFYYFWVTRVPKTVTYTYVHDYFTAMLPVEMVTITFINVFLTLRIIFKHNFEFQKFFKLGTAFEILHLMILIPLTIDWVIEEKYMKAYLIEDFEYKVWEESDGTFIESDEFPYDWAFTQEYHECCGVNSYKDYFAHHENDTVGSFDPSTFIFNVTCCPLRVKENCSMTDVFKDGCYPKEWKIYMTYTLGNMGFLIFIFCFYVFLNRFVGFYWKYFSQISDERRQEDPFKKSETKQKWKSWEIANRRRMDHMDPAD